MTPGQSPGKSRAGGTPGAGRGEEILPRVLRGARPCISAAQVPAVVPTALGDHGDGNLPRGWSCTEGLQVGFKPFQTRSNTFQEGEEEREEVRWAVIPQPMAPGAAMGQPAPSLAGGAHASAYSWPPLGILGTRHRRGQRGGDSLITQGEDPDSRPSSSPFIADGLWREAGHSVASVTRVVRTAQCRAEVGGTRPEQCSTSGPGLEGGRPPRFVKAEVSPRGRLIFRYN